MIHSKGTAILSEEIIHQHLYEHYHIAVGDMVPLGGYSNQTFKIAAKDGSKYVARISHPNKCLARINQEAYVLNRLSLLGCANVPRIVKSVINEDFHKIEFAGRKSPLQLLYYLPGEVKYNWSEKCPKEDLQAVFSALALLHMRMAKIPVPSEDSTVAIKADLPFLMDYCIATQPLGKYLQQHFNHFLNRAKKLITVSEQLFSNASQKQFIHGDIHLENLLFDGKENVAFLDFECVRVAPLEVDVIFSAFRACKVGKEDDQLHYDPKDIKVALEAYAVKNHSLYHLVKEFEEKEPLWKALFCLDQAILYLTQCEKGIWELEEGIGFLPCFNEVLAYEE